MSLYYKNTLIAGTLEAGDGLEKKNDTISVTTPVQGIMTEEDFSVLPEEQRRKGLYVIDDGASGGGTSEVYDELERIIGTWFGKPLYRRTFIGLTTPEDDSGKDILNLSELFVDTVVSLNGGLIDSNGMIPLNCYTYSWYVSTFVRTINGVKTVRIFATGDRHNSEVTITLEYTKTTD